MLLAPAHTCRRLSETFIRSYCLCLRFYPLCNHSTNLFVCQPLKSKIPCFVYRGFLSFLYMIMSPSSCSCLYAALLNICYKLTGFRRVGCRCLLFAHSLHDGSKNQSSKRTGTKNLPAKCHWEVHHCCLEPYRNEIVACVLKK